MSRRQDQENAFIEEQAKKLGPMTDTFEIALRYGFAAGYEAAYEYARRSGREAKRREIADAITFEERTIP